MHEELMAQEELNNALLKLNDALIKYEASQTKVLEVLKGLFQDGNNLKTAMTMTRDFIELTKNKYGK